MVAENMATILPERTHVRIVREPYWKEWEDFTDKHGEVCSRPVGDPEFYFTRLCIQLWLDRMVGDPPIRCLHLDVAWRDEDIARCDTPNRAAAFVNDHGANAFRSFQRYGEEYGIEPPKSLRELLRRKIAIEAMAHGVFTFKETE